jgi:hypothetical protein
MVIDWDFKNGCISPPLNKRMFKLSYIRIQKQSKHLESPLTFALFSHIDELIE